MLNRFCSCPGCRTIIPIGQQYCSAHQIIGKKQEASRHTSYDKHVRLTRDKQYHNFYLSTEWERTKQHVHNIYHGLCLYSLLVEGKAVEAAHVHHIEPIKEAWSKRLDIDNLIPLSASKHNEVEAVYKTDGKLQMQVFLRSLLDRWNAEYRGVGGSKKF